MKLQGQVALVTGGGRGIGSAVCERLASLGAAVAVNYSRSADSANELVKRIETAGGRALAVQFDVSDEEGVERGIKQIVEQLGGLDILVNNAGIAIDGLILRTKAEDWKRTIDINLTGAFLCSRAASKIMVKAKKGGRIINISSVIGEMGNAGQVAYSASKSGLFGMTKSLARELGSRAVTVNAITPGYIETEMTSGMSEEQVTALLQQIPLGRIGQSDDVAELVAFLAQPAAGYITGEIIAVNGGMHM